MKTTGRRWMAAAAVAAAMLSASGVEAQVFTPTFMAPRSSSDLGIYLNDGPGDFSVEGIMRRAGGGYDLGLRLGVAEILDDAALLLGGELRNPLALGTAPLDLAFTAGVQGVIGEVDAIGLQAGLSIGHTFVSPGLAITPYLHPRIGMIDGWGANDDFDLEVLADLGVDVQFNGNLALRLGIPLEEHGSDWGIGLAWR